MKHIIYLLLLVFTGTLLMAQPNVFDHAIVNAASFAKVALPNSSIAQGSFFTVFGTNMGPAKSPSLAFPLQTTLGGASVTVAAGGQNFNAIPLFVGPGQINAVLPSSVPVGPATLTVNFNGTSNTVSFQVVPHSFGIFTVAQSGAGPGVIDDGTSTLYTLTHSALAGDTAIIWGTGLTGVSGNEAGGPLPGDHPDVPAEVWVGLQKAAITYRGRSGCCVGVDQIVFTVPKGVTGCHVPVAVKIGDIVSNFPTMPIAATTAAPARVCTDGAVTATDLSKYEAQGSFSSGSVTLDRTTTTSPGLPPPFGTGQPTTSTSDFGGAGFAKYVFTQLLAAQNPFSVTSIGTCNVFAFAGGSATSVDPIVPKILDAGPAITVKGPNGTKQLPKDSAGEYSAQLGGGSGANIQPLFLDPGAYTVTGPGGADVGPFTANINIAAPLTWTNEASVTTITRSAGQLVTWSGGDPSSTVIIEGSSIMLGTNPDGSDTVGGFFFCTAPDSALQFNIPALVLDNLPPSVTNPDIPIPTGSLSIASFQTVSFTATGIDQGAVSSTVSVGKSVTYQ
jgi:uncharacterized protein (TIGR03437 family)